MSSELQDIKKALFSNYYSFLNEQQQKAVLAPDGAVLVIAGAGSGKTTVLINRISYLIRYGNAYHSDCEIQASPAELEMLRTMAENSELYDRSILEPILMGFANNPCPPDRILAITFTNKAAGEIKERLRSEVGENALDIWSGTFHSVCVRLLKRFGDLTSYGKDFTIYDQDDSKKIISTLLKENEIDDEELTPKFINNVISRAKNALQTPEDFKSKNQGSEKRRICARIYQEYQKRLVDANAMDFDDLIFNTVLLLSENNEALRWCQNKFRYIFVDEYQDTNHAQYLLMKLIAGECGNVMVVGDDDQSIYKFRGAAVENILNFDQQFANTNVILLEQNYRSTRNILEAANSVIANNEARRGKKLWSKNRIGRRISMHQLQDQEKEASFIADTIAKIVTNERRPYRNFAVLYRTKAQSNVLETVFTKSGIPHRLLAGLRFYDHAEIKDVLAYLRLLNNKNDFVSLNRIINVPRRGIGSTTLEKAQALANQNGISLYQILANSADFEEIKRSHGKLSDFIDLIEYLSKYASEHTPSETIHAILDKSGYWASLQGELNEERRKNVEELISSAVAFEERSVNGSLAEFLEEVALVSDVDQYDKTSDSVVLMTIHAAKGLEFPIVFLSGMEENLFPSSQSALTAADLEEERRLAYVAMTRAKEELFMTCCYQRMLYGRTNCNKVSRFVEEIPDDCIYRNLYTPLSQDSMSNLNPYERKFKIYSVSSFERSPSSDPIRNAQKPRSSSPSPQKEKPPRFYPGDRVIHPLFGAGTIESAKDYGGDVLYQIQFDFTGTKKLMASYAKLTKA